jgi:hypothetical protein
MGKYMLQGMRSGRKILKSFDRKPRCPHSQSQKAQDVGLTKLFLIRIISFHVANQNIASLIRTSPLLRVFGAPCPVISQRRIHNFSLLFLAATAYVSSRPLTSLRRPATGHDIPRRAARQCTLPPSPARWRRSGRWRR